jgi:hypothetical protein
MQCGLEVIGTGEACIAVRCRIEASQASLSRVQEIADTAFGGIRIARDDSVIACIIGEV